MTPKITALSYSGGVQSHAILEMVLRGDIERPENFIVLNADPGMEDERSYHFVAGAKQRCADVGIPFYTAKGPNLYDALTHFKERGVRRIDNPPYWTRNRDTGKAGKAKQKCTRHFKLAPMRRALRAHMRLLGIKLSRESIVEQWVGFAADELDRMRKITIDVKFITLRFPLIEMGLDRLRVEGYYLKHNIPKPPRSVCVACYANGLAYFEDMYLNRPDDWDKAVAVDDAVRDMRSVGIKDEVFVSSSLVPLRDLPDKDFLRGTPERKQHQCNSGVCFT